jgi:DNA modification methylase
MTGGDFDPNFGNPHFGVDCLDPELGLPRLAREIRLGSLPRFDLCLTDPPYNLGAGPHSQGGSQESVEKRGYGDRMDPRRYEVFSNAWFYWSRRVARMVVFTPGDPNLGMWLDIERPKDVFVVYKVNGQGKTYLAGKNRYEHLMFYGEYERPFLFPSNVVEITVNCGALRGREFVSDHPHQKPLELYDEILRRLRPESVIDPFFGSGTSGEASLRRGVPFAAYELEGGYEAKWEERRRLVEPAPDRGQLSIDPFLK